MPIAAIHKDAPAAHLASVAARKQGKFWEFHDKLFADQKNLKLEAFRRHAEELGLDVDRFDRDFQDLNNKKVIDADLAEARSIQITGTPAFFINGRYLRGAQPFGGFAKIINSELARLGLPIPDGAQVQ